MFRNVPKKRSSRRSSQPPRARYNFKKKIAQTEAVTRLINNVSETKVKALTKLNETSPGPIALAATAYIKNFTMGGPPSQYTNFSALQGVPAPGTGASDFIGKSFYWKHTTLMMRVTTNATANPVPMRFRVICYRPRRIASQAGFTTDPTKGLFQDVNGNIVGPGTGLGPTGINGTDCMLLNINKRNFDVKSDYQFLLQPPAQNPDPTTPTRPLVQGVYPCDKIMKFHLPYQRKMFKDPNRADLIGLGHHWCVSIIADTVTRDSTANDWEVSVRGATTFLDN